MKQLAVNKNNISMDINSLFLTFLLFTSTMVSAIPTRTHLITRRGLDLSVNPFDGAAGHVDESWVKEIRSSSFPDATTEGRANTVMQQSTAIWIDTISNLDRISPNMQKASQRAQSLGRPVVIQFVVYDLPGRDCHALSSNGELRVGEDAKYVSYIDQFAELLSLNYDDNVRVVLIVEPDSLPNISTNMNNPKCAAAADGYKRGVAYALAKLSLPNVWMYIDIAHGGWLGWDSGKQSAIPVFQSVINDAKQQAQNLGNSFRHAGWASNTANYSPIHANGVPPAKQYPLVTVNGRLTYDWNPCIDEYTFTSDYATLLKSNGMPGRFIVDTSRNGVAGVRSQWGHWCNIRGAGIGYLPTVNPYPHIDAYVWTKPPGESDGHSTGTPRDGFCDPTDPNGVDALPDAPHAGNWFQSQFIQLVQNANPPLKNSGTIKINWYPTLYATGCDWEGKDLSNARVAVQDCGPLCESTPLCTHFAWTTLSGGTCWMKFGDVVPEDAISNNNPDMVCGYLKKVDWDDSTEKRGCDWPGNDIGGQGGSSDECSQICSDYPGCTHFTWSSHQGGTCWLKRGDVDKSTAFHTTDGTMVCGYVEASPPSPSPSPALPICTGDFSLPAMTNWMASVSNNTYLNELFIPGTHESGTNSLAWTAKCQDWDIAKQLNNGIRYLDARLAYMKYDDSDPDSDGAMWITHGAIDSDFALIHFMEPVYKFLDDHPSETIFLRVKQEKSTYKNDSFCGYFSEAINRKYFYEPGVGSINDIKLGNVRGKVVPLFNEIGGICDNLGFTFGGVVNDDDDKWSYDDYNQGKKHYSDLFAKSKSYNGIYVDGNNYSWRQIFLCQASGYLSILGIIPYPRGFANNLNPLVMTTVQDALDVVKDSGYQYSMTNAPKGIHTVDFPVEAQIQQMVELSLRIEKARSC